MLESFVDPRECSSRLQARLPDQEKRTPSCILQALVRLRPAGP